MRGFLGKASAALLLCTALMVLDQPLIQAEGPIIVDHRCTNLDLIPDYWLEKAKQLKVHYAHTSHGSQILSGLQGLEGLHPEYGVAIRAGTTPGLPDEESPAALRFYDGNGAGSSDTYITPDEYWDSESGREGTRGVAATGEYDLSTWTWCGQVSSSSTDIQGYLDTLDQFERDYPDMRFIYFTGHLDGSGSAGTLHRQNQQIRAYCWANDKVLFDFADIERYDPDGKDFLDLGATDTCAYSGGNWASEWCAANPGSELCDTWGDWCGSCSCAHSRKLNCNLKARAWWWLMARLAGWPGPAQCGPAIQGLLLVND